MIDWNLSSLVESSIYAYIQDFLNMDAEELSRMSDGNSDHSLVAFTMKEPIRAEVMLFGTTTWDGLMSRLA